MKKFTTITLAAGLALASLTGCGESIELSLNADDSTADDSTADDNGDAAHYGGGVCTAENEADVGDGCWPFYFDRYTDNDAANAWDTWDSNTASEQSEICDIFWELDDSDVSDSVGGGGYGWAVVDVLWATCV